MLDYLLALLSGILVKSVDWLEDERKSRHPGRFVLALLYGALIGYIIGNATFSAIFLAALVAQVFARKIDTWAHRLGFATSLLTALFFHMPGVDILLFSYFLGLAFLDEMDWIGRFRFLEDHRVILPLGALPLVLIGRWDFLLGILVFDIGYEAFNALTRNKK